VSDDTPSRSVFRRVGLFDFTLKLLGLACLAVATFTFGPAAGLAAVGAAFLAAAYLP